MLGITILSPGIGDKLQFAHFPENYYLTNNEKIIDLDHQWFFDYNPFVVRNEQPTETLNLWIESYKFKPRNSYSHSERFAFFLGRIRPYVRHPRLYRFENIKIIPNRICIHTTAKSDGGKIHDHVIDYISKTYNNFEIIQIGGKKDKKTNFMSKLGLDLWATAELIASSAIFIGVNSSMMHIASCFPRVNRKIILNRNDLTVWKPMSENDPWIDFNCQYFNQSEQDIGVTFSYRKI
jgi:hypothetical protein